MPQPYIGAHVSAAGGFRTVPGRAKAIGAEAIQIFGASPRSFAVKAIDPLDAAEYKKGLKEVGVMAVYLHAAYLVNLASPSADARRASAKNLGEHLAIAEALGADGLIFHLGSGKEMPKEKAIDYIAHAMKEILKKVPGKAALVMENSAGGGARIGSLPDDMAAIMRQMTKEELKRIKVCIDTAHSLESGLIESYTPANIRKFVDDWDKAVGIKNIVALHVNDSKTPYNSHHDRHENIGKGCIGLAGFKALAAEKRFHDKAWLLEVPGFDGTGPDAKNIQIVKGCFRS